MKRLIAEQNYSKSAYDWVEERATHLMEVTDMNEQMCWGVAWNQYKKQQKNKKKKKSASLIKKSLHDDYNRNQALLYLDGEILLGDTHQEITIEYMEKHNIMNEEEALLNIPIAYGHLVTDDNLEGGKGIYIDTDFIINVDINTLVQALKSKFPDYNIYDDNSIKGEWREDSKYKKIAKRLVRKAKTEIGKFFEDLWNSWGFIKNNEVENIMKENPECIYNDYAYRVLGIDINNLLAQKKDVIEYAEIIDFASKQIRIDQNYYCASKKFNGAVEFWEEVEKNNSDFGVVIGFNTNNALDIEKLSEKYKNSELKDYDPSFHITLKEIFCKVPPNFVIEAILLKETVFGYGQNMADEDNPISLVRDEDGEYIIS